LDGGSKKVYDQISLWISEIIYPGTKVSIEGSDASKVDIKYSFKDQPLKTFNPMNIGFGFSYALPVIVAVLTAKPGSLLIVENPEAHLHPSAQSKMGYFLGVIANAGIKLIVETHSDHIINGIQIAVAKKVINNKKVTINYFFKEDKTEEELQEDKVSGVKQQPNVNPIRIKEKGELTDWPKGFFDQSQLDYSHLTRLRKDV